MSLKSYYPQVLAAFADINRPVALAFLAAWPDPVEARKLALSDLLRWLRQHRYPRAAQEAPRIWVALQQRALEASPGQRRPQVWAVRALVAQLQALQAEHRALRKHLEELLWIEGENPKDKGNQEILELVGAFCSTRFAQGLGRAGLARVHRELQFLLRLQGDDGFALHLKGKIDLLFEDEDGGALVLDYKFSRRHPAGLEPYAFQLDCYALAARQYVRDGVPVRTGIAFLKEGRREPDLRPIATTTDPDALRQQLVGGAKRLLQHSRGFEWPGLPQEKCQAIRCGYQYRCHAGSGSGSASGEPPQNED